ncbi:MAG: hypothetical protein ABH825_01130 [Candidatus Omnitrophota bacterium]
MFFWKKKKTETAKKKPAAKRKPAKKRVVKKKKAAPRKKSIKARAKKTAAAGAMQAIGKITHYFGHVSAAVIKLTGPINTGDIILIKGHTTDFKQKVRSMQIDHVPVPSATRGQEIGLRVADRVRIGDIVFRLA